MFCIILPDAGSVGDGRAGHAGEDDRSAATLTCASPPRNRPTIALQKRSSRSVIEPMFIISAARMNSGTARMM